MNVLNTNFVATCYNKVFKIATVYTRTRFYGTNRISCTFLSTITFSMHNALANLKENITSLAVSHILTRGITCTHMTYSTYYTIYSYKAEFRSTSSNGLSDRIEHRQHGAPAP